MECYYYKIINETNSPILKNVDLTVILMMENSNRFKDDPFILNLSKKTIIQYNKGFRACKKPFGINEVKRDVVYTYYKAFEYTKNYNNVIFLEEDAEVLYYTRSHYSKVDEYISKNKFNIFTFATNGIFTKINDDFYSVDMMRSAQALIISKDERLKLAKRMKDNNFEGETDATYFDKRCITYKYPLIVQLFPETENFNSWTGNKYVNKLGITLAGVDHDKSGWEIIYTCSKLRGYFKLIVLLIYDILLIFYRK